MTTRDDADSLRMFALQVQGVAAVERRIQSWRGNSPSLKEILCSVTRLYKDGCRADVAELCITLDAVPMTVDQRKLVNGGLRRLSDAAAPINDRDRMTRKERHAEMAIELITDEIGIDSYHDAARAVLATWRAAVQIREDQGLPVKPSAVAASAVNMAVAVAKDRDAIKKLFAVFNISATSGGALTAAERLVAAAQRAHVSSCDGSWLVGIKRKWDSWRSDDPKAKAQRRVIDVLRALRESMDDPLTIAIDETIEVLEYMLNEIPF